MISSVFRAILCCCSSEQNDDHNTYDERMHLIIPETIEATADHSEEARLNQRRLKERLTEIVRSTEGKMVNVASQIPFNLHNRIIPKTQSLSSSYSTLDSVIPYHDDSTFYSDLDPNRDIARLRKERSKYYHGLGRLRSTSPSFHGSDDNTAFRTRSPSPIVEQPIPSRPLNIRLVGYSDPSPRGRARERTEHPTGLPGLRKPESPTTVQVVSDIQESASAEDSPSARRSVTFAHQFPDANAMILTWD